MRGGGEDVRGGGGLTRPWERELPPEREAVRRGGGPAAVLPPPHPAPPRRAGSRWRATNRLVDPPASGACSWRAFSVPTFLSPFVSVRL